MDSFTFCRFINAVQFPADHILVSFDVVSLFTCIPREMVKSAVQMKWNKIKPHTNMDHKQFETLVMFCLECSFFSYRGKYYKQIFGTAMGNPLSPAAADLVMELLLESVLPQLDFPIPLLRKYVDDLVLALPHDKVQDVLNVFNSYDRNLQFTCETERDGRLPFLDMVLVRKEDQFIRTEWYSKPMSSGRFLDFLSCHPLHMKMNMIVNFIRRVTEFSTNLPKKEIDNIIDKHLKINHYPMTLRHRLINRASTRTSTVDSSTGIAPVMYRPLPFVNGLTQRIKKSLKVDFPNVMIATRNENTINRLFTNTKDRVTNEMKTNVIYRIPCADCKASYVGLTTQHLKTRLSKHRSQLKKLEGLSGSPNCNSPTILHEIQQMKEMTAVLKHSIEEQHKFELDNTQILDQHRRPAALDVLEMCHIINTDRTVNKRSDVDGISGTYAGILHSVTKIRRSRQVTQTQLPNHTLQ